MSTTLDEIIERNRRSGQSWFEPETMAFFSTQIVTQPRRDRFGLGSTWWFITSEQFDPSDPSDRRYTIREERNGQITTIGQFRGHQTLEDALRALDGIIEAESLWPEEEEVEEDLEPLEDAERLCGHTTCDDPDDL